MARPLNKKWFIIVGLLAHQMTWAIDLQPGDVTAPQPDTQIMQVSYWNSEKGAYYINNQNFYPNTKINSEQMLFRYGHSFDIDHSPAFAYIQAPTGSISPKGMLASLPGDSGLGDTTVAAGIWPYANRETNTYFAVGAYLTAPTGSYSKDRLMNMGQNRYSTALQTGYQMSLAQHLHWMQAVDVVWFGENAASKSPITGAIGSLKQKNLYTYQTGLLYEINQTYSIAGNYIYSIGGETSFNGSMDNDTTQVQRYQLSATAMFPIGKFTLQWGKDMTTKNGYFENSRLIVRYTNYF